MSYAGAPHQLDRIAIGAPIQRIPGLAPNTYVQVDQPPRAWYGKIVRDLGQTYEIRVGGTQRIVAVAQDRVRLHPTVAAMPAAAARATTNVAPKPAADDWVADFSQMPAPPAPIGLVDVPIGGMRRSAGDLETKALGDCVAVVAHDAGTGNSVMYHVNIPAQVNPGDANRLLALRGMYQANRTAMLAALNATGTVSYAFVVGGIWQHTIDKVKHGYDWIAKMMQMLRDEFGANAYSGCGTVATWSATAKKLTKS